MPATFSAGLRITFLCAALLAATCGAAAQDTTGKAEPTSQPTSAPALMPNIAPGVPQNITVAERSPIESLALPQLNIPPGALIGAAVVLILFATNRPFVTGRTLDALVLAAGCLLLSLRDGHSTLLGPNTIWLTYTLLTLIGAYWLARGLVFMRATTIARSEIGIGEAAQAVLAIGALVYGLNLLAFAPLTKASQDGLVGGVHFLNSGHMPYGETVGYDGQSPLIYAMHAGVATIMPPEIAVGSELVPLTWEKRALWSTVAWPDAEGVAAARMVNAILFLLCFIGLTTLGRWLHSVPMGLALATAFAVLPGITECLTRPDIMLPVTLLIWTVVFAMLPGLGALLAGALLVIAGLAWPWIWLAIPAFIAWFATRGWVGTVGALGVLTGAAGAIMLTIGLTLPSLPRANGAIEAAGITTTHTARLDGSTVVVSASPGVQSTSTGMRAKLWQMLMDRESGAVTGTNVRVESGAASGTTSYREIAVADDARVALEPTYRAAVADSGYLPRLRTVLEAVWLPQDASPSIARGAWSQWGGEDPARQEQMVTVRRAIKVAVGVLAILLAVMILVNRLNQPFQLLGVLTAICAASLIASESGAVADLALLLTPALMLFAVDGSAARSATASGKPGPAMDVPAPPAVRGSSPRISVE